MWPLIVLYFILSYLFSSGSQLVWLCCFSLTDPRTSAMLLPLVWTSKWALWDGSAHTAVTQGVDILINTGRDTWFSWGCEAAFMPGKGEVGRVGSAWTARRDFGGALPPLCHVLRRHNELHYNYNTGWTQKGQNRYLSRGWRGLFHWDFGLRARSFTLFNAIAH